MVNNTNNPLELLVSISADTEGSKASIQSQLAKLSSELKSLELGVSIDDSGFKTFEKGAKSSFSGVSSSADKLVSQLTGEFEGMGKKVANQVADIEKQLKGRDFTIKTDVDIKDGQEVLKRVQVDVKETEDLINRITYSVKNVDGEFQLVEKHIQAINSETFNLSKSFNDTTSKLKILHQEGKIATDTFNELSNKAKNIQTGEGFKNLDREIKEATSSHKILTDSIKQQEAVERQLQTARQRTIDQLERMAKAGQIDYSQAGSFTDSANTAKSIEEINRLRQTVALTAQDYKKVTQEAGIASTAFTNLNHRIEDLTISTKLSSKEADIWRSKYNSTTSADGIKAINRELDVHLNKQKQANTELKQQEANQKKLNALVNEMIRVQNKNPKAFASGINPQFDGLMNEIKQIDPASKGAQKSIEGVANSFGRMKAEATVAGRESMSIMDSFKVAMEKFPVWMASSTIFFSSIRTAKEFMSIIIDIDTKMTDLRKVMQDGTDFSAVFDRATVSAEKFGQSISEVLDSYIEFAKQGYIEEELGYLADAAVIASNVGDITAQNASELMTASLIQWKMDARDSMKIIDSWNEISNNYATTTEKLAEGQSRAGSTARAMGIEFDQLNAIVGTVTAATKQSGREIGNFVKAVLPRLVGQPAQDALKSLDISLTDHEGNLRDIIQVYTEVAHAVKNVSDSDRIAVTEGLAGKFHIARMQALLDDLGSVDSMYRQIYDSSVNSAGSAIEENEEYMKSLEARMNLARVEVEKLALAIGDAFLTEGMVQGIQLFSEFLTVATTVTDKVGALPVAFGLLNAALFLISSRYRTMIVAMTQGTTSMTAQQAATVGLSTGMNRAAASTTLLSTSLRGLLAATGVGAALTLVGVAIEGLLGKMARERELREEIESITRVTTDAYKNNAEEIKVLASRYAELEASIQGKDFNVDAFKEHRDISQQLATLLPELKIGEDAHGDAILASASAVESKVARLERQLELEERLALLEDKEKFEDIKNLATSDLDKAIDRLGVFERRIANSTNKLKAWKALDMSSDINISGYEELVLTIEKLQEKREELIKSGSSSDNVDLINIEAALDNFNEWRDGYEERALYVQKHNEDIINSTMKLADITLELNGEMSSSTKNWASEIALYASESTSDIDKMSKFMEKFKSDIENNGSVTSTLENFAEAFEVLREKQSEGLNTDELSNYKKIALESFSEVQKALENLATKKGMSFDESELASLDSYLQNIKNRINDSAISLEELQSVTGLSVEELQKLIIETDGESQSLLDMANSGDSASESMYELKDAIDELSGVSQQQIDDTDELLWKYELMSNQLLELSEGTKEYESVANELNIVKEELLKLYPYLFEAGMNSLALSEKEIQAIKEEVQANDVYRAALKASRDGKLSADEDRALSGYRTAKTEIDNINEIIKALSKLAAAYRAHASTAANTAQELAENGLDSEAEDAFIRARKWQGFASQTEDSMGTYQANLKSLQDTQRSYIDTLSKSEAVLGGTTTRANKAVNDARKAKEKDTKAQKASNKETENAKFVTDQYKRSLELLRLEMAKVQQAKNKAVKGSIEHRKAIEKEIELYEKELQLNKERAKSVNSQISSGNVQKTGIVTETSTTKGNPNASYYMGSTFRRTSGFGRRNTGIAGASTNHMGADFAAPRGTDIKSLRNGKVVASYYHNAQGHVIRIQQDDGVVAQYQHMQNKSALKVGQAVSAGQSIGKVGSTGVSSGPHLHLEISQNGKKVDPIPYLKKQINAVTTSTKEIAQQASDVDGLKSDLIQLGQDELSIIDKISQAYHELVESNIAYYENLISGVDFSLTKADKTLMEHTNTSDGYRKNLEQQVKHLEYKQYLLHQEANYIREQLKNEELSASMIADLRKKLSELGLAWLDVRDAVKATNMEIINSKNLQFDDLLTGVDQSLSKIDKQLQYYEEGGFAYLAVLEEQIKHYEYKQTLLKKQENYLREQLKSGKLTKDQAKEIEMQISNIVLAWWDVENAITGVNSSMKEQSEKLADDIIDSMKAVYEHQKQQALQTIDAQIKAEEERHRKQMKIYDDELSAYEKIIQAKLREIDDQYDEDQYEKQLSKMQEERAEIQRKINLLALDDSYEAKAEKLRLEKELAEQTEKIQEFQDDRERKLRKDNLNDMLEDYKEDIENKKEAETEKYDAEIKRLQELRKQQEYHYNEILKNERKWSAIREDIRNGEIGKHKEFLKEFLDEFENMNEETLKGLQDTFYELGLSWQELLNLIDRVNNASGELSSPSTPDSSTPEGAKSIIDKMKENSSKWSNASASERLQIEKENQILGKKIGATYHSNSGVWEKDGKHLYHSDEVQKVIDQMIANASQWQKASPEERKRLEELNRVLGKSIGATYNSGTGTWYKNGLRLYHKGGIVGDKPLNKTTELANKLFNSKPNEQVIKALKGELMIPPQNIPNLFGNINELLKGVSPSPIVAGGDEYYEINFNIDKMTGSNDDVKRFGNQIMDNIKRLKGSK